MSTEQLLMLLVVGTIFAVATVTLIARRNRAADDAAKRGPELDPDLIRKTRALSRDQDIYAAPAADAFRRVNGHNVNPGRPNYPAPSPRIPREKRPLDPVHLTARELERANIRRRLAERKPLSRAGFQAAIASAPTQYRTSDQWLNWFLIYEIVLAEHGSHSTAVNTGITVLPDEPGGGQYGGAGASGGWSDPGQNGATFAAGAALIASDPGPAVQEPSRSDPSPAPSYDPPARSEPAYSAPDPDSGGGYSGGGDGT